MGSLGLIPTPAPSNKKKDGGSNKLFFNQELYLRYGIYGIYLISGLVLFLSKLLLYLRFAESQINEHA